MNRFIGVDLHKNNFTVSFYNAGIKKHEVKTYKLRELELFKKKLNRKDIIGVESTGNTRYFVDKVQDSVKEIRIINPSEFKVISMSVKKTDKYDAKMIAEYLSNDMLPLVRLKDRATFRVSSIARTRDRFVKSRTVLKNKIHGLLNGSGIVLKRKQFSSKKGLRNVFQYDVDPDIKEELEIMVEGIEYMDESIRKLDILLEERGRKLNGFESITSIKGIGNKSGAILLSVIGDINDFASVKKLTSYFGIVPRVYQSNEKVRYGSITKRGSRLGRSTLVQCTLIAIRYSPLPPLS